MRNIPKAYLIFSGYNERAIISLCRELKKNNVLFFIIASSHQDPIFFSKYSKDVIAVRRNKDLVWSEFVKIIEDIRTEKRVTKFIIIPSSEYLNSFMLNNREKLSNYNCDVPLVNKDLYNLITNKFSFMETCLKYGIRIPERLTEYSIGKIPLVAKPKNNIKFR